MAKLAVLAAALLFLLAISNATIYQTTIIAGDDDGSEFEQFQMSRRCREQIQSQQFRQCGQYLMKQQGQPGEVLILRGIRNQQEDQQMQQSLRQCCQAMENMDQQCQCTGLRQLVDKVQQEQGQGQQQGQRRRLMQIARQLPEKCGTGQACPDMKVVWY